MGGLVGCVKTRRQLFVFIECLAEGVAAHPRIDALLDVFPKASEIAGDNARALRAGDY